jgi:hypothetical protein
MRKTTASAGLALLCALMFAPAVPRAYAGSAKFLLGDQDFSDGASPLLESAITAGGAGEPFPFDGTIFGSDATNELGSFAYVHTFPATMRVTSATLTIGLLDHDSPPSLPVDTIDIFFDGVQQPDDAFIGISAYSFIFPSSASVVTMPVDPALLADGQLEVRVTATRAGSDSRFTGNSIHPDFSALTVHTPPSVVVPLPAALWSGLVTLAGLAAVKRPRKLRSDAN